MRRLTDQERQLLRDIIEQDGSICPGRDIVNRITKQGHKSLRQMAGVGFLTIEDTDDGPRYHISAQGRAEVDHG
ncbi:hypothetical protein [Devosia aurantiaca]|uniref:Uncharacterized protein n=1 Tax=Devosia aurantiaca TaxID=2714858 RepID=A0A6M1SRI6_9HYPH|nr:hypothetical protein [Devosia aurantiaca]NGP19156.1 hypothetical protein [Devosia aurantiaca]